MTSARYDWNKFGRPRVALVNRIMRWVLPCIGLAVWLACLPLALRDWTVIFAPLIFTAATVMHQVGVRTVYRAERPRPDCAAIAAMEREVYGEAFRHEGSLPRTVYRPYR